MSDFISRYCEIVSLISRGSSEYSILGCLAICKENFRIRIKEGKDSSSFFYRSNITVGFIWGIRVIGLDAFLLMSLG